MRAIDTFRLWAMIYRQIRVGSLRNRDGRIVFLWQLLFFTHVISGHVYVPMKRLVGITILTVTSPIVINVTTRGLLPVETKGSFFLWLAKFKHQKNSPLGKSPVGWQEFNKRWCLSVGLACKLVVVLLPWSQRFPLSGEDESRTGEKRKTSGFYLGLKYHFHADASLRVGICPSGSDWLIFLQTRTSIWLVRLLGNTEGTLIAKLPLVPFLIINLTLFTAGICMKFRFMTKVTRGFSLLAASRLPRGSRKTSGTRVWFCLWGQKRFSSYDSVQIRTRCANQTCCYLIGFRKDIFLKKELVWLSLEKIHVSVWKFWDFKFSVVYFSSSFAPPRLLFSCLVNRPVFVPREGKDIVGHPAWRPDTRLTRNCTTLLTFRRREWQPQLHRNPTKRTLMAAGPREARERGKDYSQSALTQRMLRLTTAITTNRKIVDQSRRVRYHRWPKEFRPGLEKKILGPKIMARKLKKRRLRKGLETKEDSFCLRSNNWMVPNFYTCNY